MPLKVSDIGEKKLIKRILKKTTKNIIDSSFFDNLSLKSLNDDAALIDFGENYLVATSDMLMKSTHFPEKMTYKQIGTKAVTVNVSDLAAMGAKPIGIIIAMGLPKDMNLEDFDEMLDGTLEACSMYNVPLIGGDTKESQELTLCGTCIGIVKKENVLMKSGAQVGDIVAVTGPLGLAASGFEVLFDDKSKLKDLDPNFKNKSLKHALSPIARLKEGISLAETGFVTSVTDITDGLVSELFEIINANDRNIGITIYEEMLPIPEEVFKIADKVNKNPLELALYWGEDFELLLTIEKDKFDLIHEKFGFYKIGHVTSSGKLIMINKNKKETTLVLGGYEHLTKS